MSKGEDIYYYLTVTNENYLHPAMPDDPEVQDGILKGMYRFKAAEACGRRAAHPASGQPEPS